MNTGKEEIIKEKINNKCDKKNQSKLREQCPGLFYRDKGDRISGYFSAHPIYEKFILRFLIIYNHLYKTEDSKVFFFASFSGTTSGSIISTDPRIKL